MNYQIKKSVFIIIIGIVLSLISFTQAAMYGGGSGTSEDPYQIWDPNQMNTIGLNPSDWGSHFKLMADIDMSNIVGNYITTFTGTFDGNGHVISNLTFTPFSSTNNAIIMNLGIENITLFSAGGSDAGGLVGYQYSGTITNCYSTGTVTSSLSSAGGLVGLQRSGTITNCYSTVTATSDSNEIDSSAIAGGLVGWQYSGTITDCYSTGEVTSYSHSYSFAWGLVGEL